MVREPGTGSGRFSGSGERRRAGEPAKECLEPTTGRCRIVAALVGGSIGSPGAGLGEELVLMVLGGDLEVEFGSHLTGPFGFWVETLE
jgi:hypothetical protein